MDKQLGFWVPVLGIAFLIGLLIAALLQYIFSSMIVSAILRAVGAA